jgi:hypothetical protein
MFPRSRRLYDQTAMNTACRTDGCDDDVETFEPRREKIAPASSSFLEPRGEGLIFAAICLIASALIYSLVVLVRFLT